MTRFKKGDYIVFFRPKEHDSEWLKYGWVYKIGVGGLNFQTSKDCRGETCTCRSVTFHTKDRWRYATPDEIERYKELDKPYDTNSQESEENIEVKKGDYIVCLDDSKYSYANSYGDILPKIDFIYKIYGTIGSTVKLQVGREYTTLLDAEIGVDFRLANKDEIALYNKENAPCSIKKESKDWYKNLKKCSQTLLSLY